jgi:hypothetical protein
VGGVNPYYFINVPFTPNSPTGALQIISGPTAIGGDRTLLVDAVTLVQRDAGQVVVQNPSFEASGTVPSPGYVPPGPMAGWTGAGGYGVNISGNGPFADNGRSLDQDNVAFLQGETSSITQVISNLVAGSTYALSYAYNARSNNTPRLQVTVDGVLVHDEFVPPVGGTNRYHTTNIVFQAIDTSAIITFTQAAAGDQTVLLDDVRVLVGSLPQVPLSIRRDVLGSVRLSWPKSAGGSWVLQSSTVLPPSWVDTGLPVGEEGDEYVVYDSAGNPQQFYRLTQR